MPELWERQPEESDAAFEAFQSYRDMGLSRSLSKVGGKLGKSETLMSRWSSDHNWVERARAWDAEQDRIIRAEQIEDIRNMRQRHADLAVDMLEKAWEAVRHLPAEELNAVAISRLVEVASRLEQKSRGDTTDAVEMRETEDKQTSPVMFYMPSNGRNPELEANTAEKPTEE